MRGDGLTPDEAAHALRCLDALEQQPAPVIEKALDGSFAPALIVKLRSGTQPH